MNLVIEDDYLEELIKTNSNPEGKRKYPVAVENKFLFRIGQIQAAINENDLRNNRTLHFEKLKGNRKETYSIGVKDGWRIIFRLEGNGLIKIMHIEELSNHYAK